MLCSTTKIEKHLAVICQYCCSIILLTHHASDALKKIAGNSFPTIPNLEETVYEYYVNEATLDWEHWQVRVPPWKFPRVLEFTKYFNFVNYYYSFI